MPVPLPVTALSGLPASVEISLPNRVASDRSRDHSGVAPLVAQAVAILFAKWRRA